MLGGIDLCRLFNRSVVEPEDNVPVIVKVGACHRDGLVGIVSEDGKGAGSIESKSAYSVGVNVMLGEDSMNGGADASPDIVGGLFLTYVLAMKWCIR